MSQATPASATASSIRALRDYAIRRRLIGLRILPSLAVAALPCLVAVVAAIGGRVDPFELYGEFIVPLTIYFVVPFVAMFSVLPLLGELYENGAIGYLYIRPAPRWAPLLGIYSALSFDTDLIPGTVRRFMKRRLFSFFFVCLILISQ